MSTPTPNPTGNGHPNDETSQTAPPTHEPPETLSTGVPLLTLLSMAAVFAVVIALAAVLLVKTQKPKHKIVQNEATKSGTTSKDTWLHFNLPLLLTQLHGFI